MTTDTTPDGTGDLVAVRATVNLGDAHTRVPVGHRTLVNPDEPYIKERLAGGYLVPLPQAEQPADTRQARP